MNNDIYVEISTVDGDIKKCKVFNLFIYDNKEYAILISEEGEIVPTGLVDADSEHVEFTSLSDEEYEEIMGLLKDIMLTIKDDDGTEKTGQIFEELSYNGSRYVKCFVEDHEELVVLKERITRMGEVIYGNIDEEEKELVLAANRQTTCCENACVYDEEDTVTVTIDGEEIIAEIDRLFKYDNKYYAMIVEKETDDPYLIEVVTDVMGRKKYKEIASEEELVKVAIAFEKLS